MSYCKTKTRFIAEVSIKEFLRRHPQVYWWTFTEPGRVDGVLLWNKTEAESALKPFLEYLRRRGASILVVWELQKRGSWHPHILTTVKIDVNWLRPWMMKRGWGQQMKVFFIRGGGLAALAGAPASVRVEQERLVDYLTKALRRYLAKARTDDSVEPRKKFFGGDRLSKAGNIKFAWNPAVETAHAYLYARGRSLFFDIYLTAPTFHDIGCCIRLGMEDTDWLDVDFLYEPPWSGNG